MLIFPNATLRLVLRSGDPGDHHLLRLEYFVKNKDVLAKGTM